jgi:hypothetical protein
MAFPVRKSRPKIADKVRSLEKKKYRSPATEKRAAIADQCRDGANPFAPLFATSRREPRKAASSSSTAAWIGEYGGCRDVLVIEQGDEFRMFGEVIE